MYICLLNMIENSHKGKESTLIYMDMIEISMYKDKKKRQSDNQTITTKP